MKRSLDSSDSLGALMSICPPTDEQSPRNNHNVYSREFQTMLEGLEEEGCIDEPGGHVSEKKRRLSVDQVKALEKNFEVENKLEPDRKVKLAQELGLQPRQVAVWFQNRRARWKTKQLERDYGVLKANYDALKLNHDAIQRDNENLLKEIRELKSKLKEENTGNNNLSVKDEIILPAEATTKAVLEDDNHAPPPLYSDGNNITSSLDLEDQEVLNYDTLNESNNGIHGGIGLGASLFTDFKDGSSDSDSSAILNEDNNNSNNIHGSPNNKNLLTSPSSSINCFQFTKTSSFQSQFVKMEEHNFFGDEACNFFSDEQPPSLPWYCSDPWS